MNLGHVVVGPFMKLAIFRIIVSGKSGGIDQVGSFGVIGSKLAKKVQKSTKLGSWMKITVLGGNWKSLACFHLGKEIAKEKGIQVI